MKINLHTHTYRCGHARGADREYVESAIKGGFSVLGFSDHSPISWGNDYDRDSRMCFDDLDGYVNELYRLKKEYSNRVDIRIGLELEYYPAYIEGTIKRLQSKGIEYILLGQHCLGNQIGDIVCRRATRKTDELKRYVDQVIEAMSTGLFLYVAHPDIFNFVGDSNVYEKEIERLCIASKKFGIPLEINISGIQHNRHYPNKIFWKIAGGVGNEAVIGYDAHSPEKLIDEKSFVVATEIAKKNGIKLVNPLMKID